MPDCGFPWRLYEEGRFVVDGCRIAVAGVSFPHCRREEVGLLAVVSL